LIRADGHALVASTKAQALCREAPAVLVLTRKSNQSIMIGDDIEVSVLAIMGEKVRIGIEAPRSVPVFRKEVYVEIQQDRAAEDSKAEVDEALEKLKSPEGGSSGS
jgi:carbon storage regulator